MIPSSGGETILLVEDEDLVRTAARRLLVRAGYDVVDTGDPFEALRIVEQHPKAIALLLTDVVMPKMGGQMLAKRLTDLRPGIRVLYMSGYTDSAIVSNGVLAPGTAFLQKPLTWASLTRSVRLALDEPPRETASDPSPDQEAGGHGDFPPAPSAPSQVGLPDSSRRSIS